MITALAGYKYDRVIRRKREDKVRWGTTYRHERSDLLPILYELDANTFPNGGVGLFGFNANFFKNNTLSVR